MKKRALFIAFGVALVLSTIFHFYQMYVGRPFGSWTSTEYAILIWLGVAVAMVYGIFSEPDDKDE